MPVSIAGETYWTLPELLLQFPRKLRPSEATLRRYIRKGQLPAVKLGRGTIISAAAVRQLLAGPLPAQRPNPVTADTPGKLRGVPAKVRPNFARALALDKRRKT